MLILIVIIIITIYLNEIKINVKQFLIVLFTIEDLQILISNCALKGPSSNTFISFDYIIIVLLFLKYGGFRIIVN